MQIKKKSTKKETIFSKIESIKDPVERVLTFIGCLKLPDSKHPDKKFELIDWQIELITNVYGTIDIDGDRVYQNIYLEISKKNGKSGLMSGLALYHLFFEDDNAAEIYTCAVDRSQAKIVFNGSLNILRLCPELLEKCQIIESRNIIKYRKNKIDNVYQVLSADVPSKHGLKPSCVFFDEIHAYPNRDLYDIMQTGSGFSRQNPIRWIITTAGNDPDRSTIGWEVHAKAKKIIEEGIKNDWYCKIYTIPESMDVFDEKNWKLANPSLGKIIPVKKFRKEAENAKEGVVQEQNFRWLMCNQWVQIKALEWINVAFYDKCINTIDNELIMGCQCIIGLDLSRVTDLTGVTIYFPKQADMKKDYVKYKIFVPEESFKKRLKQDSHWYEWKQKGYVNVCEGHTIEYEDIFNCIKEISLDYRIKNLGFDRMFAGMFTQKLDKELDIELIEIPQTFTGLSPSMKNIEKKIYDMTIDFEYNPCARFCFSNVMVQSDTNGNIRPDKKHSLSSIDPIVALIDAVALEEETSSVYEDRGMVFLDG